MRIAHFILSLPVAIAERSPARSRASMVAHTLGQTPMPAPISEKACAASYMSTRIRSPHSLRSATASTSPPIPPPLQACKGVSSGAVVWLSKHLHDRDSQCRLIGHVVAMLRRKRAIQIACLSLYIVSDDACAARTPGSRLLRFQ